MKAQTNITTIVFVLVLGLAVLAIATIILSKNVNKSDDKSDSTMCYTHLFNWCREECVQDSNPTWTNTECFSDLSDSERLEKCKKLNPAFENC